jgi:aspartyl-tRNA(Asn)/glutamyl-tRNA(Gln) amidotransferase subunit C
MADAFSREDLTRVATLARLALTGEEHELFARQLAQVLDYARQVQSVDTQQVPPTSHPTGANSPLRDDEVQPSLPRDAALAQAPDADRAAGLFKVPRVIG